MDPWPSDQRVSVLLTKLPNNLSLVNKKVLQDKINFWKLRLENSLKYNGKIIFNLEEVLSDETYNLLYKGKKGPDVSILNYILGVDGHLCGLGEIFFGNFFSVREKYVLDF